MDNLRSQAVGLSETLRSQMTPAARYGLVVLFLLVCVFGLRAFSETLSELRLEAGRTAGDLTLLSDESAEKTWQERAERAREAESAWKAHIWTAASEGVGAARLEVALRAVATEAGVTKLQLTVSPETIRRDEISFLRFSLSGEMPSGSFHKLIAGIGTSKPDLMLTDLQLAAQREDAVTVKLEGLAPFEAE